MIKPDIWRQVREIDRVNSTLQAFLPEADRSERIQNDLQNANNHNASDLPLAGVSVGIKDIFNVNGLLTRAGSLLPAETFHGKQAKVVTRLKKAGAIVIGKTVTTEFATVGTPAETVNPVNSDYSPGGSSSGSAAAVAAGLCDVAVGSQTVGSTLRPASYCGVVGFKCSYGRIPTEGMINFSPALDTVGLFAKTVKKLESVAQVVVNNWNTNKVKNKKPRLGIPIGSYLDQTDQDVLGVYWKTVQKLEESGYTIVQIPLFENIGEINHDLLNLAAHEFARVHKKWYQQYGELYRPNTRGLIEKGRQIDKKTYRKNLRKRKKLRRYIGKEMTNNSIDLWVAPAATSYPPEMSKNNTGNPAMNIPWTFAGLPSISIPISEPDRLPFGLQLVAQYGRDEQLIFDSERIELELIV